ncbi:sodium/hydrogen exchanger [Denitrovibrio acetiphilus DSM 12809]|uniref:Sodium/hydrogen exchanger n=1 Tax=Denitrovibrio acetiphilus (strain DSM 12809 / NBRC 114555 / N2460) TaxID=522772 RepID=D4H490_DENA2|nr:sodium/hydrogen exchanger [Denitrovibrio acetiphilus DSM 12809]
MSERPESLFMVFGIALLLAFISGRLLNSFGLPAITSFLLMGILLGPYSMNVFTKEMINELRLIDDVALSIIAMTAGGEILFRGSRICLRKVFVFVTAQVVVTFSLVFMFLYFFGGFFPGGVFSGLTAIIFMSVIANAKSPATTVAVIVETEAKGKLTDYTLTSAIIKDIMIIIIFAFVLSIYSVEGDVSVGGVIVEEFLSMAAGLILSLIIILYIKYVKANQGVFIILFTIVMTGIAKNMHLNPLLVFLFAGIGVNNFSDYGHMLVKNIEDNSGIIYLVFFFIAGTVVDLPALKVMWIAAFGIVFLRAFATFAGCWIGGTIIREDKYIRNYSFLGFIGQAGVSIGFAKIIGASFGDWGGQLQTLVLAVVAINQIAGPIGFKWALKRAGETKLSL